MIFNYKVLGAWRKFAVMHHYKRTETTSKVCLAQEALGKGEFYFSQRASLIVKILTWSQLVFICHRLSYAYTSVMGVTLPP